MTDKDLADILFASSRLRVLDLRGCSRITPSGLASLQCNELECLFWGQYFSSNLGSSAPKTGIYMVAQKWSRTLRELDIANQLFTAEDLELAMTYLTQVAEADRMCSLNLSGTRITLSCPQVSNWPHEGSQLPQYFILSVPSKRSEENLSWERRYSPVTGQVIFILNPNICYFSW
uniref:Uncharacterized protein n=2 Tax=Tetraodon nigroviridis TaxID=99883 RepID=H3CB77_TETNG